MWSNLKSLSNAGMQNGGATLQKNLTVSYQVKYALFVWPSNSPTKSLSWKNEAYIHRNTIIWMFIAA